MTLRNIVDLWNGIRRPIHTVHLFTTHPSRRRRYGGAGAISHRVSTLK